MVALAMWCALLQSEEWAIPVELHRGDGLAMPLSITAVGTTITVVALLQGEKSTEFRFYRSLDAGKTWKLETRLEERPSIPALAIDRNAVRGMFLARNRRFHFRSVDLGTGEWSNAIEMPASADVVDEHVWCSLVEFKDKLHYLIADKARAKPVSIVASSDKGATWSSTEITGWQIMQANPAQPVFTVAGSKMYVFSNPESGRLEQRVSEDGVRWTTSEHRMRSGSFVLWGNCTGDRIVLFCGARRERSHDGEIWTILSDDQGRTWRDGGVVVTCTFGGGALPASIGVQDKRVLFAWTRIPEGGGLEAAEAMVLRSDETLMKWTDLRLSSGLARRNVYAVACSTRDAHYAAFVNVSDAKRFTSPYLLFRRWGKRDPDILDDAARGRLDECMRQLRDDDVSVRDRASSSIVKMGLCALPTVEKALAGEADKAVRATLESIRSRLRPEWLASP